MIVMKFGGSSLESAQAIRRVASIIRSHRDEHPAVVVSAMGKTTDRLLAIARFSAAGIHKAAQREVAELREFHIRQVAALLSADQARATRSMIDDHFAELDFVLDEIAAAADLTPRLCDAVLSFGERLSSQIMTAVLRRAGVDAVHLDARSVIVTDGHHTCAAPQLIETNALLRRKVSEEQVTVMGGFIGATEDGIPTTLGRGGSDYTAAIVGAAIGADEIQIWTDVDGMLTCDPRIVPEAHCLRSISYLEAEEMAKSGAKVLHPATVLPAIRQRIPIVILNSRNPGAPGTRIVDHVKSGEGAVLSIACRTDITLLHVCPKNTPVTSEFGRAIWEAFAEAGVSVELISPAVKEFSLAIDTAGLKPALRSRLSALAGLHIECGRALVTLVGRNISRNTANLVRASQRLATLQGGAMLTCCTDSRIAFVVTTESLHEAASALHREFFSQPDTGMFIPDRHAASIAETAPVKAGGTPIAVLTNA